MPRLIYWALGFLITALLSAGLGFGGMAGSAGGPFRALFWVSIVLFTAAVGGCLVRPD